MLKQRCCCCSALLCPCNSSHFNNHPAEAPNEYILQMILLTGTRSMMSLCEHPFDLFLQCFLKLFLSWTLIFSATVWNQIQPLESILCLTHLTLLRLLNLKHCSGGALVSGNHWKMVWTWLIPKAEPAALITSAQEHKWWFHSIYQEITQGAIWFSHFLFFSSVSPAFQFAIYTFKINSGIVFNMLSDKRPFLLVLFRTNTDTIRNTREHPSWGV